MKKFYPAFGCFSVAGIFHGLGSQWFEHGKGLNVVGGADIFNIFSLLVLGLGSFLLWVWPMFYEK